MTDTMLDELEARPKAKPVSHQLLQETAPLIFIHSARRTSSTWFWSKFRELSSTQCCYEPFNFSLQWITADKASWLGGDSWDSRHTPTKPYYLEYSPLIRPTGGVELFDPAMTMQLFIPVGGLRGELRGSEREYLTQLARLAEKARKLPVFGEVWSLGRMWAIKQALGGFHIFQYRNLWLQWLSYLWYKQVKGSRTSYCSVLDTIFRDDDPYFRWLIERGLELASDPGTGQDPKASPLWWNRSYANFARDEDTVRRLELLPEPRVFALFMGMRIYLYLHAQLCADLTADATRMHRDAGYRAEIERAVRQHTGLAVSFADVTDLERPSGVEFDRGAVDWDEVREYARVAVEMLSKFGDPEQLAVSAAAFVDETIEEARKDDLKSAASNGGAAPETPSIVSQVPAASDGGAAPETPPEVSQPPAASDGGAAPETSSLVSQAPAASEGGAAPETPPEISQAPAASEAAPTPEDSSLTTQAAQAKTVGVCMIVKNETATIRRCLSSVLPLVDYVLIVDTGSTDGTQQVIREFLSEHNVAGAVIDEPWRDFAYNRSFAMERLREVASIDYGMVIDADDTLEYDAGFDPRAFKAQLTHDLYYVPVRHGSVVHHRPQLFKNRLRFSFKGVLHEYLETPPGELSRETVKGFAVHASTGGARSQNPRKYQDDAAVLEHALTTETDPFLISRYTFYLAQSYRDSGEREKALTNYLKRAELGYWDEEVYVSLFEAGNMMAALDRPFEEVIATYERAARKVPARAEALHNAAHYCRSKGKNAEGMEFARRGIDLTQPNGLFVQPWVYDYAILDEFAINAYWAGAYRDSLDACLKLLASDKLPASMAKRIAANARFSFDKLPAAKAPNLGALGAEDLVQQHALVPQRPLHSRVKDSPRVLVAILAKQKEPALPLYLDCIEALDYPKSSIVLYIRTNNNTDRTEQILRDWVARVGHLYHSVEFDSTNVTERVEQYGEHEWNATRFNVLARIRNQSMRRALELDCDFYFVADVDNFIRPATLRELVALDLPIASPLLRSIAPGQYYSNYHAEIDANGYYRSCDQYLWLLERRVRGVVEVPVIHCTYLVRTDVIPNLTYEDVTGRHEYVVFSDSARKAQVPQYLDNRQVYGYITFGKDDDHYVAGGIEHARNLLHAAGDLSVLSAKQRAAASRTISPVRIYLLNLDRSPERLAAFQKRNPDLRNFIRVAAVDGSLLDREKPVNEGLVARDCEYKAGALGCALSHVHLWKRAVEENSAITVFEDDAVVTSRFEEKAARVISTLPEDWDFIQWGYNFNPLFVWADFGFSKATLRFYHQQFQGPGISTFQTTDFSASAVRLAHSYGTVAYSVSPKGARSLLAQCVPLSSRLIPFPGTEVIAGNWGINSAMNGAYSSMRAFICMPPLVLEDKALDSDRVAMDGKVPSSTALPDMPVKVVP